MRSWLDVRTGGRRGWQTDLVARSGVKRQTISKWTNPDFDGYPDLATLAALADALGVRPWEVVAALDGDAPVLDAAMTDAIRRAVEEVLDERLGPRRDKRG